jgi:hypothetical protein
MGEFLEGTDMVEMAVRHDDGIGARVGPEKALGPLADTGPGKPKTSVHQRPPADPARNREHVDQQNVKSLYVVADVIEICDVPVG